MHIRTNVFRNPLEQNLTKKLLKLFIVKVSHDGIKTASNEYVFDKKWTKELENLKKEEIDMDFSGQQLSIAKISITTTLVTLEVEIEKPIKNVPCSRLFYQCVKFIEFTTSDEELVIAIQNKFKKFIMRKKGIGQLPERFVKAIHFDGDN